LVIFFFFSFGKRTPNNQYRINECVVLEPSEMLVVSRHDIEICLIIDNKHCERRRRKKNEKLPFVTHWSFTLLFFLCLFVSFFFCFFVFNRLIIPSLIMLCKSTIHWSASVTNTIVSTNKPYHRLTNNKQI